MPRGSSSKREHEYKKIVGKMKKTGEYKGREKEVAARIVNKQRARTGETKGSKGRKSSSRSSSSRTSSRSSSHKKSR